jgi:outer membrane receptor protein involved in Fe transport
VVDATLTTQLTKHIELYAGVNNLFSEEYADLGLYFGSPFVYPAARRNGFLGLRYRRPF